AKVSVDTRASSAPRGALSRSLAEGDGVLVHALADDSGLSGCADRRRDGESRNRVRYVLVAVRLHRRAIEKMPEDLYVEPDGTARGDRPGLRQDHRDRRGSPTHLDEAVRRHSLDADRLRRTDQHV